MDLKGQELIISAPKLLCTPTVNLTHALSCPHGNPAQEMLPHLLSDNSSQKANPITRKSAVLGKPPPSRPPLPHRARPHPRVEVSVQRHTQQVNCVFGGAIGLPASAVLHVLEVEVRFHCIAR